MEGMGGQNKYCAAPRANNQCGTARMGSAGFTSPAVRPRRRRWRSAPSRAHFIKVFPGNETNLEWVDGE
eukprot:gene33604-41463_t